MTYYTPARNKALAVKLFDHVRGGTTDQFDEVLEYDLGIYSDPALAETERSRIFQRRPVMAAHSAQLPEPKSFITLRMNRSNVLVTRAADGQVRAFLNACRHRGATLETEAAGKKALFSCPYHGWSYSADGALQRVTFEDSFGEAPDCVRTGLIPLPVEERHGFIWIVENPEGEIDVASFLGPEMDQLLAEYGLDKWFVYRDETFDFPQNWKVMMDGLIDGYHVQFLHGKTISPYFYTNMMGSEVMGRHMYWGSPRRAIDKILDEAPGDSPLDRYVIFGNLVTPNSVMVLQPHHIEFWTVYQGAGVSSCRLHLRYLVPDPEQDERGHQILAKNWHIAVSAIVNEDIPVGNSIQSSADMPFRPKAHLGRNEIVNQLFHRTYRADLEG
jgi:phenylpropionate dioxygenase-like ring-hydroxylating dioxygenase large terminal subunit